LCRKITYLLFPIGYVLFVLLTAPSLSPPVEATQVTGIDATDYSEGEDVVGLIILGDLQELESAVENIQNDQISNTADISGTKLDDSSVTWIKMYPNWTAHRAYIIFSGDSTFADSVVARAFKDYSIQLEKIERPPWTGGLTYEDTARVFAVGKCRVGAAGDTLFPAGGDPSSFGFNLAYADCTEMNGIAFDNPPRISITPVFRAVTTEKAPLVHMVTKISKDSCRVKFFCATDDTLVGKFDVHWQAAGK